MVHFAVNALGITDPATLTAREVLVVSFVVTLSVIAVVYQRLLEKEKQRLALEHRQVTEQLELNERMEAVGRLAGGVAHDLNNVLQVVSAASELLSQRLSKDSQGQTELQMIDGAIARSATLTDQLTTMSKRKRSEPQLVDLNELVGEIVQMLDHMMSAEVELKVDLDTDLGLIEADRKEMEQVIMNLVANARDAMPDGGTLEIGTRASQNAATLSLRDTGAGIDDVTRFHMFEPFFSTKPAAHNRGLGLAVVYGIVTRCGGHIDVDSTHGQGTTLTVTFPVVSSDSTALESTGSLSSHVVGGSESVLLVEDEEAIRALVGRLLEELGYRVVTAADAEEALEKLQKPFDLLLTDVLMPGLNGVQLAELVQAKHPGTAVVLMSGYIGEASEVAGADGYRLLRKPFTRRDLAEMVRRELDERIAGTG